MPTVAPIGPPTPIQVLEATLISAQTPTPVPTDTPTPISTLTGTPTPGGEGKGWWDGWKKEFLEGFLKPGPWTDAVAGAIVGVAGTIALLLLRKLAKPLGTHSKQVSAQKVDTIQKEASPGSGSKINGSKLEDTSNQGTGSDSDQGKASQQKVDINHADLKTLEALPGIGPYLARQIIEYREQVGLFATIDDIMKVSGIGPKTLEKLRDKIIISS
jgi:comEA protein